MAPELTVVVPVHNGIGLLERSLSALAESTLPREGWELLVVDDASTDGSGDRARRMGHRVLRIEDGPRGPGAARNLAAAEARGAILVFVDADVCVRPDVLERFRGHFQASPDVGAVFGAYDDQPTDPGFLSQYRNLYHRWTHLRWAGDAATFWAGCGAVRRDLFLRLGGFDTVRYPRPQIEDIELGYRIRDAGQRIVLDPRIEATHLKRWTLSGMVRTDLRDRALPWMRLLLARGGGDPTLNVAPGERLRTAAMGLACLLVLLGLATGRPWLATSALAPLAALVASNLGLYRWFAEQRGFVFALGVVPLNLLFYLLAGSGAALALILEGAERVAGRATGPSDPAPLRRRTGPTPVSGRDRS